MDFPVRYVSHNQMVGKYTLNMEHFWDSPERREIHPMDWDYGTRTAIFQDGNQSW